MATKKVEMQDELGNVYHPHTTSGVVFMENGQTAETAVNGKAPKNHASSGEDYGKGTSSSYGHVKLSDSTTSTDGVSAGVAATPEAVRKVGAMASAYTYTVADGTIYPKSKRPVAYAYANDTTETLDVVINNIQNSFDSLGGTIFLNQGTYYINAPIVLNPRVRLLGCGRGTVLVRNFYTPAEGETQPKMIVLADECAVESVRLYYGVGGSTTATMLPYFSTPSITTPVTDVTLRDIERESVYSTGSAANGEVFFHGSLENSRISNCKLENCKSGVLMIKSKHVIVENCDFSYSSDYSIRAWSNSSNITIKNNTVIHSGKAAISLSASPSSMISGNDVSYCQNISTSASPGAICIDPGSNYLVIENNIVHDCEGVAIAANRAFYSTVRGNTCVNNKYGIISPIWGCTVGNTLVDNYNWDISTTGYDTITGNAIRVTDSTKVSASHKGIITSYEYPTTIVGNMIDFCNGDPTTFPSGFETIYISGAKNCVVTGNNILGKDVTDTNTDTTNKNIKANNKYSGTQG